MYFFTPGDQYGLFLIQLITFFMSTQHLRKLLFALLLTGYTISAMAQPSPMREDNLPKDYLTAEFHAGRREALRAAMPANSVAAIVKSRYASRTRFASALSPRCKSIGVTDVENKIGVLDRVWRDFIPTCR